ncbi:hypothetical protein THAOC_28215, partial [Thalassiosira oceanica]
MCRRTLRLQVRRPARRRVSSPPACGAVDEGRTEQADEGEDERGPQEGGEAASSGRGGRRSAQLVQPIQPSASWRVVDQADELEGAVAYPHALTIFGFVPARVLAGGRVRRRPAPALNPLEGKDRDHLDVGLARQREGAKVSGGMDESRQCARKGNDAVARTPAEEGRSPELTDAAAATKIAELQEELEALKQSHNLVVGELNDKVKELEAEVDALQAENETQKCEMKGLNSALQWAYAIERIPRQHWLENGNDEEYADAMENLLSSMKESIKDLRMGTVSNDNGESIEIDFDLQDEDENYIRADHDESLMPYWKELAAALRHWSEYHADGKCLKVCIYSIELPKSVLDILRPAFEQSRIENVFFEDNGHAGDLADFANKVLQANHFITGVGFGDIKFAQEDVKTVCGAIESRNAGSQPIKGLALRTCFDGGINTCTLKMILGTVTTAGAMTGLGLFGNQMSSREAAVIASILTSNPCLSQLDIDGNRFGDTDAAELADALSSNTHLRHISIENNGIEENGRLAFLRAILTFRV